MEEASGAFRRANCLRCKSFCTDSSNVCDLRKAPWLSKSHQARIPECPESDGASAREKEDFYAKGNPHSVKSAHVNLDEGDKSSQVSTVGLSGISDDSDIGTLPPGGEVALTGNDSDHQKTEESVGSEAVQQALEITHPTLLGCDAFRSSRVQLTSTHTPWNFNRHQGGHNQKDGSPLFTWSTLRRTEKESHSLEGKRTALQKGTSAALRSHPPNSHAPNMYIPRYSRLFLLRIFLSSGAPTRAKTKQRLQPPPGSHIRLDGLKEVFYDTKVAERGVVSDLKKSLRRKNRTENGTNSGAFQTDKCHTEAPQRARGVVFPCNMKHGSCLTRVPRDSALGDNSHAVGIKVYNHSMQTATTIAPLTVGACLNSRSWITSLSSSVNWTTSPAQTDASRKIPPLPQLGTRKETCPLWPGQTDQYKNRSYTGKWKCPLMPSGVSTTSQGNQRQL